MYLLLPQIHKPNHPGRPMPAVVHRTYFQLFRPNYGKLYYLTWRTANTHLERNDQGASKPVASQFNLPNHSRQHMAVCGLSLHVGSLESRKTVEQKNYLSNHSTDLFLFSRYEGKRAWSSTNESLPVYASPLISEIYNIFATARTIGILPNDLYNSYIFHFHRELHS